MKELALLQRYRDELEAELISSVGDSPLPLYSMMRYHMGWENSSGQREGHGAGKRLRGLLCLFVCEAVGGEYHKALPAAAAVELVHNFSLVHDDIQDNSPLRRHRPTVWSLWKRSQAINVGDGLYTLGSLTFLRLTQQGIEQSRILRGICLLDEACLGLCDGQYLDVSFQDCWDVGVDSYLQMVEKKTGALMGCAMEIGALLGTHDETTISKFGQCGRKLGQAYQIKDDELDFWGESATGKTASLDIKNRRKSLPIAYFLDKADPQAREELIRIYQGEEIGDEEIQRVLNLLQGVDAQGFARQLAEKFCREALKIMDEAKVTPVSNVKLEDLASFILERTY